MKIKWTKPKPIIMDVNHEDIGQELFSAGKKYVDYKYFHTAIFQKPFYVPGFSS